MDNYHYKSEMISLDGSPEEIQTLFQYWQNKCSPDSMPAKEDIVPWEMPKHLGRLCIIEVTQNPLDFIYRVDGTNTSVSATSDLRNKSILEGEPIDIYRRMYDDLAKTVQLCAPVLWRVRYRHDIYSYYYLRLTLPLKKEKPADTLMTFSYNLESINGLFDAVR